MLTASTCHLFASTFSLHYYARSPTFALRGRKKKEFQSLVKKIKYLSGWLTYLLFGRKEIVQTNYLLIGQIKAAQILGACSPW